MKSAKLSRSPVVIDAHHHLWHYIPAEFDWIDDRMAAIQRSFHVEDLAAAMQTADVQWSVAVQARQSLAETRMLLDAAASSPNMIAGIVGWLPLAHRKTLESILPTLCDEKLLCGARHVVQGEAAGFLDGADFNDGIRLLTECGLTYDLLLRADQLREAMRFVDRHPGQAFVLDHLAKPRIAAGELEPWAGDLRELARRPNVCCKLSGMVTEDDWQHWSLESLRPFLDTAVEVFSTSRLMAGSDWPVCLLASSYGRWWQTLRRYFAAFSESERSDLLGGNAMRFYGLTRPHASA